MGNASIVTIERLGGLAGFGAPGGHLRSRGRVDLSTLKAADREAVEALFTGKHVEKPGAADIFRYRLALGDKTVEVPEHVVPGVISSAVHDELI